MNQPGSVEPSLSALMPLSVPFPGMFRLLKPKPSLSFSACVKSKNIYTNVYAIMNPPMFTAMNSTVSHANSTTAFNTVMVHFC